MKKISLISIFFVYQIAFLFPLLAEDLAFFRKNLGDAPPGFNWILCHDGFLALRLPEGWHFKEEGPSANGTMACFITKEKLERARSEYDTGFSINILPKFYERHSQHPSQYAKRFISALAKETKTNNGKIEKFLETDYGTMKGIVFRYTRNLPSKNRQGVVDTTVHQFLLSNDKTSTLYISTFESPTTDWPTAWAIGEKIVGKLGIISNK